LAVQRGGRAGISNDGPSAGSKIHGFRARCRDTGSRQWGSYFTMHPEGGGRRTSQRKVALVMSCVGKNEEELPMLHQTEGGKVWKLECPVSEKRWEREHDMFVDGGGRIRLRAFGKGERGTRWGGKKILWYSAPRKERVVARGKTLYILAMAGMGMSILRRLQWGGIVGKLKLHFGGGGSDGKEGQGPLPRAG